MKKILKNNNGFSLLELIIALAILSIIIIPISSLFINSAKATNSANDKMIALSIAQGEMERIKLQDNLEEGKIEGNDEKFSYEINIEEVKQKTEDESSEDTNKDNTQDENQQEIQNQIAIDSSSLENNDYILVINESAHYDIIKKTNNTDINPNIKLTKSEDEPLKILIKDSNTEINKEKPVKIEVSNESIYSLEIYTEKESNISIINKLGEIKVYKNYSKQNNTSNLYKINIKVYKGKKDDLDKKLIEEIQSYKNIVQ